MIKLSGGVPRLSFGLTLYLFQSLRKLFIKIVQALAQGVEVAKSGGGALPLFKREKYTAEKTLYPR